MPKYLLESPLVMIEPLFALVIHSTYVDDDIAGVENLGIASSFELWSKWPTTNIELKENGVV